MNDDNFYSLSQLPLDKRIAFLKLFVGLSCFIEQTEIIEISKLKFARENKDCGKEITRFFDLRYKKITKNSNTYIMFNARKNIFCYFSNKCFSDNKSIKEFESILNERIIAFLIAAVTNNFEFLNTNQNFKCLRELFNVDKYPFQFVLGSGVNDGYGMPKWGDLKKRFERSVDSRLGDGSCEKMVEATFNVNYGSFQVLKDLDYYEYKNQICNMIKYSSHPTTKDNTILLAVAKLLTCGDPLKKQTVVTFNYDGLLEEAINLLGFDCSSEYKTKHKIHSLPSWILIKHTHGYLFEPIHPSLSSAFESIILTTDEYYKSYKNDTSYAYRSLYNQLDKTTYFIGNSITDYEEQKVLAAHLKNHPSQFHFMFAGIDHSNLIGMAYKTFSLIKIGVIPLWFETHDEYKKILFDYASSKKP